MLSIRLARFGKRNQPSYRLVVNQKHKDTSGNYLDNLGSLNYFGGKKNLVLDKAKAAKWLKNGAQPSATVRNLFIEEGLLTGQKSKPRGIKQSPKTETPAGTGHSEKSTEPAAKQEPATAKPIEKSSVQPTETKPEKPAN